MSTRIITYRPQRMLVARVLGTGILALALVVFASTAVLALSHARASILATLVLVYIALFIGLAIWSMKVWMLQFDEKGYAVRFIRGAGVRTATWEQVAELETSSPRGIDCLILHLADGRTTTIPVGALDTDREELVREVRTRLASTQPPLQP